MISDEVGINKKIENNNNLTFSKITCIGIIQFFVSEFGLIIVIGLILILVNVIPQYHSKKTFTSKNISDFVFSKDPIIFIHTTDLHISTTRKERTDGSSIFLISLYEYNPDLFLLTGDYVDNVKKGEEFSQQNLEEWKIYNTTIRNILINKKFKVIDISGNHDQWAVDSYDSEDNNYLDNSFIYNRTNVKSETDFYLRNIKLNINNINISFMLINDYRYPVFRSPYGEEPHSTVKQLDLIEKTLNSIEEKDIFVLFHYPVDRAWLLESKDGHTFEEIISNEKIYAIFSGHEHPTNVKIVHHGENGGLEFCTASPFDNKRAGLITLDNGNLVYHEVYIPYYGSKPLFFLTYPVPNEQLTSHHIFNIRSFDIRVISYYPDKNINLKIEGDINGNLEYDHTLNNGVFLFKYHVDNMQEGEYKIHIYDQNGIGCDINTEFTIGETYTGKKEKYVLNVNFLLAMRFIIIPIFIFLLIIVFPFFPELNFNIVKNIEKIIEGNSIKNDINKVLIYICLIFLSPFFYRCRLQSTSEINKVIRFAIFVAFIYPLVFPIHFMQGIKGKVGYVFLVFVYCDKKVHYEHWAVQMSLLYYGTTLFPFILFASGKKYYSKNTKIIIIINAILSIVLLCLSFFITFYNVNQSISFVYLFYSTAFVYVFIILLILFIIYFF